MGRPYETFLYTGVLSEMYNRSLQRIVNAGYKGLQIIHSDTQSADRGRME
jgi:hypothetical protein